MLTLSGFAQAKDPDDVSTADKAAARQAMDEGDALMAARQYPEALAKYKAADAIMEVPTTTLLVGKAYEAMGKLLEAQEAYLVVGRYTRSPGKEMPDAFIQAKAEAARLGVAIKSRLPKLQITVKGLAPGVEPEVTINGQPITTVGNLARPVNPGTAEIGAKAPGYLEETQSITIAEGETKSVELTLEAGAANPADPAPAGNGDTTGGGPPSWPWAFVAIGGAALIAGAGTGIASLVIAGKVKDECGADGDTVCGPDENPVDNEGRIDRSIALANASNALLPIGGVLAAVGVVLLLVLEEDTTEPAAALSPLVGPGTFGFRF